MPDVLLVLIPLVAVAVLLVLAFVRRRRVAPVYLNGEEQAVTAELSQQQPVTSRTQPYAEPPPEPPTGRD